MTYNVTSQPLTNRYFSTAGFSNNNALYAWGNNSIGQLGQGNTTNYSSPVQVGPATLPPTWLKLAPGAIQVTAIQTNNTLWGWGFNNNGGLGLNTVSLYVSSPIQVGSLSTWSQVSSGNQFFVAIQSNGTLWSCGYNGFGALAQNNTQNYSSPVQIGALTTWTKVACALGGIYMAAIQSNGTLYACGINSWGQLGTGNQINYSSLIQVGLLSVWQQVACGYRHTLAIQSNGTLWAWGANSYGQLGTNNQTNLSSPVQIGALSTWAQISCGSDFTSAVQSNGTLWAWGYNNFGQLGQNNTLTYSSPVQVGSLSTWTQTACGAYQTLALQNNGSLYAWGYNAFGQLGNNSTTNFSSPIQVGTLSVWSNIIQANGNNFSVAIQSNGSLWSWGQNNWSQLGQGNTVNYSSPVQIGTPVNQTLFTQVSCGYNYFSLGIQSPGTLWSWGGNSYGQLGVNTSGVNNTSSPVRVGALNYWTQVAAGNSHWLAVQSPGTLWSCGYNGYGQLGNNTSSTSQGASTPIQVGALTTWTQVAGGNYSSYARQNTGTLWSWGYNNFGQLGQSNTTNYSSPVQVGLLSNWTNISVNSTSASALALQSAGTLWAWGYNAYGQLGNSNTTSQSSPIQIGALTLWKQIAAGGYSSYAIQSNGTLWAWGLNSQGQLGLNTTVGVSSPIQIGTASNWAQIGAGALQLAAIQNNGSLWMCGYSVQGQSGNNTNTNISVLTQVGSLNKWNSATGARQILAQQIP